MRFVLPCLVATMLVACAADPHSTAAASTGGSAPAPAGSASAVQVAQVCAKETPIGSTIPHTVCRNVDDGPAFDPNRQLSIQTYSVPPQGIGK